MKSDSICEACQRIDFSKALGALDDGVLETDGVAMVLDDDADRFLPPLAIKSACDICRLLSNAVVRILHNDPKTGYRLYACSYLQNAPGMRIEDREDQKSWGARDSVALIVAHPERSKGTSLFLLPGFFHNGGGMKGYTVCHWTHDRRPGLFKPQLVKSKFNPGLARLWIANCEEDHGSRCSEELAVQSIPGMHLVDYTAATVVRAGPSMRWVALSYRWGTERGLPVHDISRPSVVVEDAMTVTRSLGYRYLWVDKYCINQQDVKDRDDQIEKMDLIYRNAELVIIAAAGPDEHYGLPGVGSTQRIDRQSVIQLDKVALMNTGPDPATHVEKTSEWWKRAWTFQEGLLPRRRLIFTEHQSFFECSCSSWNEAFGGVECIPNRKLVDWSKWRFGTYLLAQYGQVNFFTAQQVTDQDVDHWQDFKRSNTLEQFHGLMRLLQQYTTRQLTVEADSLRAVTGILSYLSKHTVPPVLHLSGLPYVPVADPNSKAELFNQMMYLVLSWFHITSNDGSFVPNSRRRDLPSWSWSGWAGATRWDAYAFHGFNDRRFGLLPRFRMIELEATSGQKMAAAEYLRLRDMLENHPDSAVAFHFEAPIVPAALFRNTGTWHTFEIYNPALGIGAGVETDNLKKPPTETPSEFMQRIEDGVWSCLWMGDWIWKEDSTSVSRFLLVVEWKESGTAERVGALFSGFEQKYNKAFESLPLIREEDIQWAKVRLV